MKSWSGKTRGGILGYKIFVFLLSTFGLASAYLLLRFVSLYFVFFAPKAYRSIFSYFRNVHGYGVVKSFFKTYLNFYVFGQVLVDKVALLAGLTDKLTFDFEGEEFIRQMASDKTGGILLSAHVGNWEVAGQLLNRIDCPINILLLEAEHQRIKDFLSKIMVVKTENQKVNIIVEKEDFSHLFQINSLVQRNEILGLHADRFLPGGKVLKTTFFGKEAAFPYGPFYLAARFSVPVSFTFAMKDSRNRYHFYASKPKTYLWQRKNSELIIKTVLADYILELEKILKKYPEQWFNYYNFWEATLS
jgi:predicted LPLAT superfamily acyltransferase